MSYQGQMAKFLGLAEDAKQVTTLPITIEYLYPNYATTLQGVSSLYLMRLPVSAQESRSFASIFLSRPPPPMGDSVNAKNSGSGPTSIFSSKSSLAQDKEMMESEQENYHVNPLRHYAEINPAIIAISAHDIATI